MEDVAYPIRVAKLLGIDKLVITNNAGGINKSFCPGDLMIITDYMGGDAVGMSTVPEAIAANHCGMRILGLTLLTCMAAGVAGTPMDTDEVIRIAEEGAGRFEAMMTEFVRRI